jgi:catechol 2,3-dioxygenase-like lactoylglutathione lyase family enzyme
MSFDHIDLRVRNLDEAKFFYDRLMPFIGFPNAYPTSLGIAYEAESDHPKPEFIGLIEDLNHRPSATRIAFGAADKNAVDQATHMASLAGACNVEGPMFCPEYSPTYYASFFDDPSGNRLEICCRTASRMIRAPWDCLAGCIWLARLTDKIRLANDGKLPPDYRAFLGHRRGVDGHFLRHFELDKKAVLEAIKNHLDDSDVEQWFLQQPTVNQSRIKIWNELAPNLGRRGWPCEQELAIAIERFYRVSDGDTPVETLFELIRRDENFPLPSNNTQSSEITPQS